MKKFLIELRPFLSVLIIVGSLFSVAFLQMEERRLGYNILKLNKELKIAKEQKRTAIVQLARFTKPQRVELLAQHRGHLKKINNEQLIHLTGAEWMTQH